MMDGSTAMNTNRLHLLFGLSLVAASALGQTKAATTLSLNINGLDFKGSQMTGTMYMPSGVTLSETKPSWVKKEPSYRGTPQYGVLKLGNGPHPNHVIA